MLCGRSCRSGSSLWEGNVRHDIVARVVSTRHEFGLTRKLAGRILIVLLRPLDAHQHCRGGRCVVGLNLSGGQLRADCWRLAGLGLWNGGRGHQRF